MKPFIYVYSIQEYDIYLKSSYSLNISTFTVLPLPSKIQWQMDTITTRMANALNVRRM